MEIDEKENRTISRQGSSEGDTPSPWSNPLLNNVNLSQPITLHIAKASEPIYRERNNKKNKDKEDE